jgi:hypothetical protein
MGCAIGGLLLYALGQYQSDFINARMWEADQRQESSRAYCYRVATFGPICISDDNATQADAERAEHDLQAQQNMAEWAKWVTIFTAAQVGIGLLGLIGLWRTVKLTNKATRAATSATRAAIDANKISQQSAERQLRAYVLVEKMQIKYFEIGRVLMVEVTVTNSGQTPAREVRHGVIMQFCDSDVYPPGRVRLARPNTKKRGSVVDIGAGAPYTFYVESSVPLSQDLHDKLVSGEIRCEVGGYLSFRDVFTRRRLVTFRGYMASDQNGNFRVYVADRNNRSN